MAGAAISPPATRAVEPSRSFFIILPLSLIKLVRTKRPVRPAECGSLERSTHCPRRYGFAIEHRPERRVKNWSRRCTILPAPVASLSQFGLAPDLLAGDF